MVCCFSHFYFLKKLLFIFLNNFFKYVFVVLDIYDSHFATNNYFAGEEYSLADLFHAPNARIILTVATFVLLFVRFCVTFVRHSVYYCVPGCFRGPPKFGGLV